MPLLLLWRIDSVTVYVRTDLWQITNSQEITENFHLGQEGNDGSLLNELMKQSELRHGRE